MHVAQYIQKKQEFHGTSLRVQHIVRKKRIRGKVLYLVKWKGYGSDENTWEPRSSFDDDPETYDWRSK
jgi:hypothetical protein